jgi:DNA-directed RNA polymerase alpha subunit
LVFERLKCLNFKKINKKNELNEHPFGVIQLTEPCEFKSKYIRLPDNLEVINPEEKIFSFNTDKLNIFILLKFVM